MVKKIAKRILPVVIRKNIFLHYNKIRIHTVDKIVFPERKVAIGEFLIYKRENPLVRFGVQLDNTGDGEVDKFMSYWNNWSQEEYIYICRDRGFIEPDYGWMLTDRGLLNYYSLGLSRAPHQRKPSFKYRFSRNLKVRHFPKIISLRDTGEENYFHLYNDVLTKLFFLEENGIDVGNLPVLIASSLANKPYFRFVKEKHPFLNRVKWIIQDNDCISADEFIFCKPLTHTPRLLNKVIQPLLQQYAADKGDQTIFLIRDRKRLRFIENFEEVKNVCEKYGILMVDADKLRMEEQIELFSGAKNVVGVHGAGLTNMLFGKPPYNVLEIFPPSKEGYLPFHYELLAKQLGFNYLGMLGHKSHKLEGGFCVSVGDLEKKLQSLVHNN